jgi:hypothetical protein
MAHLPVRAHWPPGSASVDRIGSNWEENEVIDKRNSNQDAPAVDWIEKRSSEHHDLKP